MIEYRKKQKRKWKRIAILLVFMVFITIIFIYIHINNSLSFALSQSLGTFDIHSVTYPTIESESVTLNITFILQNPTTYPMIVESIILSPYIDNHQIVGLSVPLEEEISPGENQLFFFERKVTTEYVLQSIKKENYVLRVEGKINGISKYLFIQRKLEKVVTSIDTIEGINQAKS